MADSVERLRRVVVELGRDAARSCVVVVVDLGRGETKAVHGTFRKNGLLRHTHLVPTAFRHGEPPCALAFPAGHPSGTASAMRSVGWASGLVLGGLIACGSAGEGAHPPEASSPDAAPPKEAGTTPPPEPTDAGSTPVDEPKIELNIVFVHGVTQADSGRRVAHEQLIDLEKGVLDRIAARGNDRVNVSTARVNIYTDESGELISPRIDDLKDGTGLPTATAWRAQLLKKTNAVFPTGKNIVFVGHSTGGASQRRSAPPSKCATAWRASSPSRE